MASDQAHREAVRRYRRNHPDRAKACTVRWRADNRARVLAKKAEWYTSHPGAKSAHGSVYWGKQAGTIRPEPCAECGDQQAEAHHANGYEREHWRDVVWLCKACHRVLHQKEKEQ